MATMVQYNQGSTTITRDGTRIQSILDIDFENGLHIYAFPGSLSPNDILVKFRDSNIPRTQIRQPKHIHWTVDLLIKRDNEPELTRRFLELMLERWEAIRGFPNRNYDTLVGNLSLSRNTEFVSQFRSLDDHGFFSMDFIIHVMEILMLQEKTNNPNAYMFRDVVTQLMNSDDLYAIISKATHTGR